ncbi:MAG TPA: CapA family protein, partial [Bacteroidota bacterium]
MRRRLFVAWIVCSAISASAQVRRDSTQLVFWAFGDVNLGRSVGKELLKGNVDYPFEHVRDSLRTADVVFVNLESQLSDQGGETQNPKDVYAFCGPPEGALSLRKANISVVSTANNHAYDYGMRGLRETIESLQKEDVQFTGTSQDSVGKFPPVFIEKNGIRLGILSYTEFVNRKGGWQGRISVF